MKIDSSVTPTVMHVKIGYALLKPSEGSDVVTSEASVVKYTASGRLFAIGCLNLKDWGGDRSEPISYRLARTFDK